VLNNNSKKKEREKKKKTEGKIENCAMCVYAHIMPRRHLTVNNLCIPEVRYCFCFPCTVLLQHGADPNIRNTDGKSALDLADPSAKAVLTGKMHTSLGCVTCSSFCLYKFSIIKAFCFFAFSVV